MTVEDISSINWLTRYNFVIFDEIDSTNDEAKRLLESGVNGDFIIWSKSQSKGRGRDNKFWVSDHGNLYCSILLLPRLNRAFGSDLSFLAAVAVGEALCKISKDSGIIQYKWPNDVFLNNKKVSGILLESYFSGNIPYAKSVIIGIGTNVNNFPEDERPSSYLRTSSAARRGVKLELHEILDEVIKSFTFWFDIWYKHGITPIINKWLSRCKGLGEQVTAVSGDSSVSGTFSGISQEGAMILSLPDKQERLISSGKVFYLGSKEVYGS